MNDSKIPVRYSRALFELAIEKKVLDNVYRDMLLIAEVCRFPEVKELLTSPIIIPSKKREALHKIFGNSLEKITGDFIDLVVKNERESFFPAITRAFIKETKEHKGITESLLTTAIKIDSKIKERITEMVAGIYKTRVEIKEVIEPAIIGGFILRIEDDYIDASVRNKLRKVEKALKGIVLTT
jgi:F-type H+-transporting ATPase subunit delta